MFRLPPPDETSLNRKIGLAGASMGQTFVAGGHLAVL
jgi:hypothetical protein